MCFGALHALVLAVVCQLIFPNAAFAEHVVRLCNTGNAVVLTATIEESGPYDTGIATISGWKTIKPGECLPRYHIDLRTYFAFLQPLSDGGLANPVYSPTGRTEKGTVRSMCVKPRATFEVSGTPREMYARYTNTTCPAGYDSVRVSFGATYSTSDAVTTLSIDTDNRSPGPSISPVPGGSSRAGTASDAPRAPADRKFRTKIEADGDYVVFDVPDGIVPNLGIDPRQSKGVVARIDGTPKPYGVLWEIEFGRMNVGMMAYKARKEVFSNSEINRLDALYAQTPATRMWLCRYQDAGTELYWHADTPQPSADLLKALAPLNIGVAKECPARARSNP